MLCEICQKNMVEKKIQFMLGGTAKELNVCSQCSEKYEVQNPFSGLPDALTVLMLDKMVKSLAPEMTAKELAQRCKKCGATMLRFRQTGTFGCPECYHTFKELIAALLIRIHGSSKHIGSRPLRKRRITASIDTAEVKNQLALAIQNENYEKAAELRDLLRDAESSAIPE